MKRMKMVSIVGAALLLAVGAAVAFSYRGGAEGRNDAMAVKNADEPEAVHQDAGPMDPRLSRATTEFGFKLFGDIGGRNKGKNIFISPASIAMALAMTYNGAEAETKQAMARVLGFDSLSLDEIDRGFASLRAASASSDAKVRLDIANSLWGRSGVQFKQEFLQRNKQFFGAEISTLDFSDPASASKINGWVKDKTNGKIDKIIDQTDAMAVLYLLNAIYFKGAWRDEFKKSETKHEPFKLAGGSQPQVSMMHREGRYGYLQTEDFQAVNLLYGVGRVSMYVFLPAEGSSLDGLERKLNSGNWNQWMSHFVRTPGELGLPRFKLEFDASLKETLSALGMGVAFDSERASFAGIAETRNRLFISGVKHKSFCEVNEEGTEAAAATGVEMATASVMQKPEPFRMIVDRPFFFAIRDNETGVLLFMGSVVDPR
ncbi:MAG: proteinase inhibitor I4 serpin [Blastocatellia bacterium AA13]|nr:MAG: proteinase inhibitor I4 serpin [Blastocatellia bacterium AA13]